MLDNGKEKLDILRLSCVVAKIIIDQDPVSTVESLKEV